MNLLYYSVGFYMLMIIHGDSNERTTKQNYCPDTAGMIGICVESCSSDDDCTGEKMCCSNGCGHVCMDPHTVSCDNTQCGKDEYCELRTATCFRAPCFPVPECISEEKDCPLPKYKEDECDNFGKPDEECEDWKCYGSQKCCHNGCYKECTQTGKWNEDTGCPVIESGMGGICTEGCSSDKDCTKVNEKCCSNGCGHTCQVAGPVTEKDACKPNPCAHGQCMSTTTNSYSCICEAGYTGVNCNKTESDVCSSSPCVHGTCKLSADGAYLCECEDGHTGTNCDMGVHDACSSNPCMNGGICTEGTSSTYTCTCQSGYIGVHCEEGVHSACSSTPCMNGGTCAQGTSNTYTCTCQSGYTGKNCEKGEECSADTCIHGECKPGTDGTSYCVCDAGYAGPKCEAVINSCASNPCVHGTCSLQATGTYTCDCEEGFSGFNCDQSGTDACSSFPCMNGGICQDGSSNTYTCTCQSGYTGPTCEIGQDICMSNPCIHGVCLHKSHQISDGYICKCDNGYHGLNCQNEMTTDSCDPNPCKNNGVCRSYGGDYECECGDTGYMGKFCHISSSSINHMHYGILTMITLLSSIWLCIGI